MNDILKWELAMFWDTLLRTFNPSWGLSPRQKYILRMRAKLPWKVKKQIFERDGYRCQIKKWNICTGRATEVDHIIPLYRYGTNDPRNLQAACHRCNHWKGIKIL